MGLGKTLIDALIASFRDALRTPDGVAEPAALLWADEDGQWRGLVRRLQALVPELYALGGYALAERTGPAIWLRCVVERSIPGVAPPAGTTPILYLPGVSRQRLRAAGDCPAALQPLIELQHRGRVWHQRNGRDWSPEAFLVSEDGLALDVAQDARTREAVLRALPLLAEVAVEGLRDHRLEAEDFDRLAVSDPIRDVLRWMSDPQSFRKELEPARWKSFCSVCERDLRLDPERVLPSDAANALVEGGGRWDVVWQRFCEAPRLYRGLSTLLREAGPNQRKLLFDDSQRRRPTGNEADEARLRQELDAASALAHGDACAKVLTLDAEHAQRRNWVWAQLGESPMALALAPLARLAGLARSPLGGATVEAMAAAYAAEGWLVDRTVLEALASARSIADQAVVTIVVRALYGPWLDASTRHFQQLVAARHDVLGGVPGTSGQKDTCTVFVDGLRFDVAGILQEKLESRSLRVRASHRLAPVPTVTATAKPLAMPMPELVGGPGLAEDFMPFMRGTDKPAIAARLREEMSRSGIAVLDTDEHGTPAGGDSSGWTEVGRLDELGHKLGAGIVGQIEAEVERVADRVVSLLDAGWGRVRVVTDHGWMLLPGGLPKVELPAYLIATKWARCAAVRGASTPAVPTYPWHWRRECMIASPPGMGSFRADVEYAHGGVSLQECVVPELVVERAEAAVRGTITGVQWRGMRCRVTVKASDPGVQIDLRLNWKDAASSIAAAVKNVGSSGEVSLAVADDAHEGAGANLVLLDATGNVVDRRPTTVGETS